MKDISAVIVAAREEQRIVACLERLSWCSEIIVVVDEDPQDRTGEVAAACGARVERRAWSGFADQKNFAASLAVNEWLLSVDADELVSDELAAEIASLPEAVREEFVAFSIPFMTFLGKKQLRYGGFAGEEHIRLWRRECGRFVGKNGSGVHEHLEIDGMVGRLSSPVLHYTYRNTLDYIRKVRLYSAMEARTLAESGGCPGAAIWLKPPAVFFKRLLLQKGILDGWPGIVSAACLSCYGWHTALTAVRLRRERRGKGN